MKYLITVFTALCLVAGSGKAQTAFIVMPEIAERAFLGVRSDHISKEKAEILGFDNHYGSYITRVIQNTAAEKAGLQPFDFVFGVDEYRTSKDQSLINILKNYKPGERAKIHYFRKGKRKTVEVTFGKPSSGISDMVIRSLQRPFFGINSHSDNSSKKLGVRVYIVANSTAGEMGLEDGDLITSINGFPMVDWTDITTAIDNMKVGQTITVEYERKGQKYQEQAPVKSYAKTKSPKRSFAPRVPHEAAFLGINYETISSSKAEKLGIDNPNGSYITKVIPNTAAERAGLEPFDYLFGIDEYRTGEDQSFGLILKKFKPGDQAIVHFIRKRDKKAAPITFGKKSEAVTIKTDKCEEAFFGIRENSKNQQIDGVGVNIVSNSTAKALGMEDGDIITSINGFPILDWSDISASINNMKAGETIRVEFVRNGNTIKESGPIKSYCDTKPQESNRYNFDFDFSDWPEKLSQTLKRRFGGISSGSDNPDISDISLEMGEISREEAREIKDEFGVDLPLTNSLNIEQLKLFPDPAEGVFLLQFELSDNGETFIRIYNSDGRLIYDYDLGNFSGEFSDEINISQNGTGDYFLLIRQGNKSLVKKIILQAN